MTRNGRNRLVTLVVLALGGLTAAGCGGGGGLSEEEYREQANAICAESEEEVLELEQPETPDDLGPFLQESVEVASEQQEDFEDLEPPDELAEAHDEAVELGDEQEELIEELADEVEESDDPAQTLLSEVSVLNDAIEESNELAEELELDDCESDPIPVPGQPQT